MAQIINRDGKDYSFPDNFTQEQIDNYFNNLENTQPEEVTEEAEEVGLDISEHDGSLAYAQFQITSKKYHK